MAIYVYRTSDGVLQSYCQTDDSPVALKSVLDEKGFTAVSGLAPLDDTHKWDPATHTVVVVAAPIPEKRIETYEFFLRFTADEADNVYSSNNKEIKRWLRAIERSTSINLNNPVVAQGVAGLVAANLITAPRATEILA